jgi:hypothetical protein
MKIRAMNGSINQVSELVLDEQPFVLTPVRIGNSENSQGQVVDRNKEETWMVQSRSLKRIIFEQSSDCPCSVWLPLADAPASMAAAISSQPGTELRINKDRPIMRATGTKSLATIGGTENRISPQRHKGHEVSANGLIWDLCLSSRVLAAYTSH